MVNPRLGLQWATNYYGKGYEALRLYGSLNIGQKAAANNGGLVVASLPETLISQVRNLYIADRTGSLVLTINALGNEPVPNVSNSSPGFDPTNTQNDTWNDSLKLFIYDRTEPSVVCGIDELGKIDVIGIPSGYSISRKGVESPVVVTGLPRRYKKYVIGSRREVRLAIGSHQNTRQYLFFDDKVKSDAPILEYGNLPKEYIEAVDRISKLVEEALKGFDDARDKP